MMLTVGDPSVAGFLVFLLVGASVLMSIALVALGLVTVWGRKAWAQLRGQQHHAGSVRPAVGEPTEVALADILTKPLP